MVDVLEDRKQKLEDFAKDLERKIEYWRDILLSYADNGRERADNYEVLRKEREGVRGFDYKRSISELVSNLSKMEPEKMEIVMNKLSHRTINYTLSGVFINKYIVKPGTIFFADLASEPHKYL